MRPETRASVKRALALPARDWLLLPEVWWGLLRAHLQLRLRSGGALRRALDAGAAESAAGSADPRRLEARLARLVRLASRLHPLPMRCLEQSICLERLLRRRGVRVRLRIGVRREGGALAAHAWLERSGRPVGELADAVPFSPLTLL